MADNWPQFRGSNAVGLAGKVPLPTEIGPTQNVLWKTPLSPGHSSPVVFGDRIYLTGVKAERLITIAIDRASGKILWEREAPHKKLEVIHKIGSHAQSSPATDGERVVSFFGSCGMFCYDREGKELWSRPMGPFNSDFGAASSPIIVDDKIILAQDHDTDSFLMMLDKKTGETVWKTDRSEFPRNYSTPVIRTHAGKREIVLAATLRIVGYDFDTGKEVWTVRGISRAVTATPSMGDDGTLYFACWAAGGDENERIRVAPWDEVVAELDKNKNGEIEEKELPKGPILQRFTQVDRDKSGALTKAEYEYYRKLFDTAENMVLAVKPGGVGDVTDTHVLWRYRKQVPFCASPLCYGSRVFCVKDGGILSCLDAASGKPAKQARLPASGEYYSSPVGGDSKIFFLNDEGKLTVITDSADWSVLHTADFGEDTYATPAIVDGRIYLRTAGHLYCFGSKN